jgi:hypothetical protein
VDKNFISSIITPQSWTLLNELTLDLIQQYMGMNTWENLIAFAGVFKSWKDATKKYTLKIGVEPMEGGRRWEKIECTWIFELFGSGEV